MRKNKVRPGKTPNNPISEQQFRQKLYQRAKALGCDGDLLQIWEKYDNALKRCTNEVERKHIGTCGVAEIHRLFGCVGGLVIDGQVIIPPDPGYEDGAAGGKIIKI